MISKSVLVQTQLRYVLLRHTVTLYFAKVLFVIIITQNLLMIHT